MAAPTTAYVGVRLREFILSSLPVAKAKQIRDDDPLFELGVLDSMGVLNVLMFVQKEFGLVVDAAELVLTNFGTIEAMTQFVGDRIGSG